MLAVLPLLEDSNFPPVHRAQLRTLQVNLGYRCNQRCLHCHVNAGPNRREEMDAGTIDLVLDFLAANPGIRTLDLTGGAPELNPHFPRLVATARGRGIRVTDRCNLTILTEPGMHWLAPFLAGHGVDIVASLPCYLEDNVDRQRGKGSFSASIEGLRLLNAQGYGLADGRLSLALAYNPQGPTLPPPQAELEHAYRAHLLAEYGIHFTRLLTLVNMPIQRFGSTLLSHQTFDAYMATLKHAHRAANLDKVMCRDQLSVDWQGYVYDCDFNQQLGLPMGAAATRRHLRELNATALAGQPVRVAGHCYGCTAGQGSSCGGALEGDDRRAHAHAG